MFFAEIAFEAAHVEALIGIDFGGEDHRLILVKTQAAHGPDILRTLPRGLGEIHTIEAQSIGRALLWEDQCDVEEEEKKKEDCFHAGASC